MACPWFSFHAWATSFARGSSGFGAPSRAWIERRMVRIWRAGDQLPGAVSGEMRGNVKTTLTLEDVEADATQSVDVGVVDLGQEAHLGRGHGIVVWEEELELEDAA
jgi:hypothetical protein